VVGHVCHGGINPWRMAYRAEPGSHDVVADARLRSDAARERAEILEAGVPRLHRSHAGILPVVSPRAAVSCAPNR